MISENVRDSVIERLLRDVKGTGTDGVAAEISRAAEVCREMSEDGTSYEQQVVDSVQQYIHDTFLDTSWPVCPAHSNHPMWFESGWWLADGQPYARLGELSDRGSV